MTDDALPFDAPAFGQSTATLSEDGRYRYVLTRRWDVGPAVVWVMLNPSTADAETDDRTIGRCRAFTRAWGYGALIVVNLYAYRATDPDNLWKQDDPVGSENDEWLLREFTIARHLQAPVVGGWGDNARPDRVAHVLTLPGAHRLQCLGTTKSGAPRHPLYIRGDTPLQPWKPL